MKTIIASLAALAAGGDDLRSSDTYFGEYSTKHNIEGSAID